MKKLIILFLGCFVGCLCFSDEFDEFGSILKSSGEDENGKLLRSAYGKMSKDPYAAEIDFNNYLSNAALVVISGDLDNKKVALDNQKLFFARLGLINSIGKQYRLYSEKREYGVHEMPDLDRYRFLCQDTIDNYLPKIAQKGAPSYGLHEKRLLHRIAQSYLWVRDLESAKKYCILAVNNQTVVITSTEAFVKQHLIALNLLAKLYDLTGDPDLANKTYVSCSVDFGYINLDHHIGLHAIINPSYIDADAYRDYLQRLLLIVPVGNDSVEFLSKIKSQLLAIE